MSQSLFPRKSLLVNRLYHEVATGYYFHTPDGVGVLWYEDFTEAMEETGAFDTGIIAIHQKLED